MRPNSVETGCTIKQEHPLSGKGQRMAASLQVIPFTPALLPTVQAFDCGSEPWEREVSDWIKRPAGEDGAVDALARGTAVWLYVNDAGELVGFGSLDKTEQRWPKAKDPKVPASIIPWVAVERRFWGQPPGRPKNATPRKSSTTSLIRQFRHEKSGLCWSSTFTSTTPAPLPSTSVPTSALWNCTSRTPTRIRGRSTSEWRWR
jgi:hypothetical protein